MANTNCTEFERLLEQSAEERQQGDLVLLRAHAALCSDCRSLLEQHTLLHQAIAVWRAATPEVDLTDAIMARWAFEQEPAPALAVAALRGNDRGTQQDAIDEQPVASRDDQIAAAPAKTVRATQQNSRRLHAAVAVCAAMLAVIAVGLTGRLAPRSAESPRPTGVRVADAVAINSRSTPIAPLPLPDQEDEEIDSLLRQAGSAYLVLAQDAASAIGHTSILVKSVNESTVLPAVPASSTADKGDVSRLVEQWGRELKPMRREFGEALDFLLDDASREQPPSI